MTRSSRFFAQASVSDNLRIASWIAFYRLLAHCTRQNTHHPAAWWQSLGGCLVLLTILSPAEILNKGGAQVDVSLQLDLHAYLRSLLPRIVCREPSRRTSQYVGYIIWSRRRSSGVAWCPTRSKVRHTCPGRHGRQKSIIRAPNGISHALFNPRRQLESAFDLRHLVSSFNPAWILCSEIISITFTRKRLNR